MPQNGCQSTVISVFCYYLDIRALLQKDSFELIRIEFIFCSITEFFSYDLITNFNPVKNLLISSN